MGTPATRILGILNLSPDSFSDGGRYDTPDAALAHGRALAATGAWGVDVGAVSSAPDAADLPAQAELERLEPVLGALRELGIPTSVDTFSPEVQRALAHRVDVVNDIRGFPDAATREVLADAACQLVVMHSVQDGRADRRPGEPARLLDRICAFFDRRLEELVRAGVAEDRLVVDPGMGFFLGAGAEASLEVLRNLPRVAFHTGRPILISVSRKSFLGDLLGGRTPLGRAAATLAAELDAVDRGATWIRTHEPGPLADALAVRRALR